MSLENGKQHTNNFKCQRSKCQLLRFICGNARISHYMLTPVMQKSVFNACRVLYTPTHKIRRGLYSRIPRNAILGITIYYLFA